LLGETPPALALLGGLLALLGIAISLSAVLHECSDLR
jgi:hypothetical protein